MSALRSPVAFFPAPAGAGIMPKASGVGTGSREENALK